MSFSTWPMAEAPCLPGRGSVSAWPKPYVWPRLYVCMAEVLATSGQVKSTLFVDALRDADGEMEDDVKAGQPRSFAFALAHC